MTEAGQLHKVLGRVPSGIYILTIKNPHGPQQTGMLCSWIMQAGFEPPTVSVAIQQDRYVADWLDAGVPFALHLVAQGGKPLLSHFGRGFEPEQPAFEGLTTEVGPHDLIILQDHVLGHLICEPRQHADSGDHRIFLAEVVEGRLRDDIPPMTHIRKSGKHY